MREREREVEGDRGMRERALNRQRVVVRSLNTFSQFRFPSYLLANTFLAPQFQFLARD